MGFVIGMRYFSQVAGIHAASNTKILQLNLTYKYIRSPTLSKYGMVASSQPLASQIGQSILQQGGNAADACCAMNIALSVTEPMCTGMGGDCFALYYKNDDKKVYGLNGSGRTSHLLTYNNFLQNLQSRNIKLSDFKLTDPLNVTVPGNCAGTLDLLTTFLPYFSMHCSSSVS